MNLNNLFENTHGVAEEWSKKYKNSINCSHPKGFSQRAHCAGKRKHNESVEMEMTCPDCGMCQTHGEHDNLDEACWKGYHKEGNKELFGKTVPNCVKNEGVAEGSGLDKFRQRVNSQGFTDSPEERNADRLERKRRHQDALNRISDIGGGSSDEERAHQAQQRMARDEYKLDRLKRNDDDWENTFDMMRDRMNRYQWSSQRDVDPEQLAAISNIKYEPRKKNEDVQAKTDDKLLAYYAQRKAEKEKQHSESCPHCGGEMVSEELMNEKKDACYYKVKSRYKVWPSAYASGALVKCRKKGADSWGNGGKKLKEFAPNDGEGGEEETLHKYARMWYNGDLGTQQQVEQILDRMGWEIGELESEEGGAFVVRSGDEHGKSYIGFTADDLTNNLDENLHKWFKEKWVRFGPDGKIRGDCARGDDSEGKPKCLPQSKAHSLGKKGRASAAARKRREDPNPERSGKAINVNTKKKSNEGVTEGSQQVDSLVTDALKLMRGPEANDAVTALKTVLGNREYNQRRGHYNFYIKQIIDAYNKQGVAEAYPGHIQKGKELDAATKKIQANLDRRIRGHELDAATKEIQKNLDKRIKKVDQGVAEGDYDIRKDPTYQKYNPETHTMMYKDGKHKAVKHDQVAKAKELGWKVRSSLKAFVKGQGGVAEGSLNEVTQGVEHSEWADNVKDHYHPTPVRIIKKRSEDGRHIGSHAMVADKKVGQYNMKTGVGTFTALKKQGVAEGSLEEIDRRGFLRGMGAAALGATGAGKALARVSPGPDGKVNDKDNRGFGKGQSNSNDLGNGFVSTTIDVAGYTVKAVLDTQTNTYYTLNRRPEGNGAIIRNMAPYIFVRDGKVNMASTVGPETAAAMKQAGLETMQEGVPESRYGRGYSSYHDELRNREREEQGYMDQQRSSFKRQELQHELGHERNNIQVVINGRPWKVFPGQGYADSQQEFQHLQKMKAWAEKKSAATGKKWTVYLTGAEPTA